MSERIRPNKLMIVYPGHRNRRLQAALGPEWKVIGYLESITGSRFDHILVTGVFEYIESHFPSTDSARERTAQWVQESLRTALNPGCENELYYL